MQDFHYPTDILIVGAGMAGLCAATALQAAGYSVQVIDKGRAVGGRLASRSIGGATFDYGAQFMTARDPRLIALLEHWREAGVATEWHRSAEDPETHRRWRGVPTIRAVAQHLACGVRILLESPLVALRRQPNGWAATLADGETLFAPAVLLTPPIPQSLVLLETAAIELLPSMKTRLENLEYERCLAVMAVLAGPTRLPSPGYRMPTGGPIAWLADNQQKGVSAAPAVTLHATPAFSREYWDRDRQASGRELLEAAKADLGEDVVEFRVHGWRYSKPLRQAEHPCCILSESPPLLLAGDAFGGPRIEGAALSGWAAAAALQALGGQSRTKTLSKV